MAVSPARTGLFYGWFVVATCMFIAFLTMGTRNAFGAFVVPMEAEFGWERTTVSWAAALGALLNGATQPFMGYLFDRVGVRIVVITGIAIVGVSTLLLTLTGSMWYLIGMFGVVAAVGQSGTSLTNTGAMLSKWFRRQRGLVIGLNASGMSLGGLILVPFAAFLIGLIDWRLTWIVLGTTILTLGIPLAWAFLHDDPSRKGLTPDGDPIPATTPGGIAAAPPPPPLFAQHWRQAFRSLPIWQMSASYFICGSTTFMLSVHFVPMAVEQGISPLLAAWIFGVMSLLNAIGATGAGWISDRIGGRKNWLALVYFSRGCAYVLLVAALTTAQIPVLAGLWIFAIVAGLSWIATAPLTTSLTAEVYGLKSLATISGVAFFFHQLGGFSSVLLAGYLREITGDYVLSFALAAAMLFPAAISAFTIRERKYSVRYQTTPAPAPGGG